MLSDIQTVEIKNIFELVAVGVIFKDTFKSAKVSVLEEEKL